MQRKAIQKAIEGLYFKGALEIYCEGDACLDSLFPDRDDLLLTGVKVEKSAFGTVDVSDIMSALALDRQQEPPDSSRDFVFCSDLFYHECKQTLLSHVLTLVRHYLLVACSATTVAKVEQAVTAAGLTVLRKVEARDLIFLLAERPCALKPFSELSEFPFVSVVIPVRNEEYYMAQCIDSLSRLDYPAASYEVIFADGQSTDRTVEIARGKGARVVDNPGIRISSGRNEGFYASRGDIVVFTDADCIFENDWLLKATDHFRRRPEVAGLSGPTRVPSDQNAFGKAVGVVFRIATMTSASVHYDACSSSFEVDDLPGCNAFYRREALNAIMPTNAALFSNEDVEMNASLRRLGYRLLMTPDVVINHYKRASFHAFRRQMRTFAIGRLQLARREKAYLSTSHKLVGFGIPALTLLWIVAGIVYPVIWVAGLAGVFLGITACMVYALKDGLSTALWTPAALVALLSGWINGFWTELLKPAGYIKNHSRIDKRVNKPR